MSAHRDLDRLLQSFLVEGPMELPDPSYDEVRDRTEQKRQRAFIGPWRTPDMNRYLKIAVAAAAVLVVAFVGFQFLGGANTGGPGASPSESPSLAESPTPAASEAAGFPAYGPVSIGRHPFTLSGVPLSMDFPTDGWVSNGEWGIDTTSLTAPDSASFILWPDSAPDTVFSDPCNETPMSPPPGRSAVELAAAVASMPGINVVSGPSAVTLGGYPAQHVVFTVPNDIGCAPDHFYLWEDLDNPGSSRYATQLGETFYIWIIQVDSSVVWIDGETYTTSNAATVQEVQDIVNSIRFE